MTLQFPVEGSCMCGRVKLRVTLPPIMTAACHCGGCQKLSASAFSLTAMIPTEGVEVIGDTAIGGLHNASKYEYCPHCLNWLITRPAGMPFVNVRPTMFSVPAWSTPFMETCAGEKLPWAKTSAVHSFDRYPQEADYGPLMQEYAARAGQ
ncbi:MAG TPA: GFA family protein [Hyphomonadaceae bacterium]|jgi:hypothetical protein|nr:GFA family protein [Hyphomonadaceae bacterium]HPI48608.1 GFA family protein [Hyphomonadaceae bacterium]